MEVIKGDATPERGSVLTLRSPDGLVYFWGNRRSTYYPQRRLGHWSLRAPTKQTRAARGRELDGRIGRPEQALRAQTVAPRT